MNNDRSSINRRRLIVDKKFQHNFVLVAVLIAILVCNLLLIYGFLFYEPLLYSSFTFKQAFGIAVVEITVIVLAGTYGLSTSKKVAGPIHGISRVLRALDDGNFSARIAIRKGEYFGDVTSRINQSLDLLEERLTSLKLAGDQVQQHASDPSSLPGHIAHLQAQLEALRTRRDTATSTSVQLKEEISDHSEASPRNADQVS